MELLLQHPALFKGENLERRNRPLKVSVLAKKILGYWVENPEASDTAKGIAVWWVQYKEVERWKPRVEKALLELVDKKLVFKKSGTTREARYELNPEKKLQVRRIVNGSVGKQASKQI